MSPEGQQMEASQAKYKTCLAIGAACETERRLYEVDRDLYDAISRRVAAEPQSVSCTYGYGVMNCN